MKIISFTLKQSGDWKVNQKVKATVEHCKKTPIFSHRLNVLQIFSFTFHFPVFLLCTDHYTHISRILMAIGNTRQIFRRIINRFPI